MDSTRESALHAGPGPVVGAALILSAAFFWATFGLFAKHLYTAGYSPLELASVRAFVGFCGFALIALLRSALVRPRAGVPRRAALQVIDALGQLRVPLRALPLLAVYGVFGFACFEYAFFAALERTSVGIAVALLYTAPAMVVLASAVIWRERIGGRRWLALLLVLLGVLLVTGAWSAWRSGAASLSTVALLIGLASGATYALFTMLSKVATERYGPGAALFWCFLFATLAFAVLASPLEPLRNRAQLPALIGLGVVPTLLPYALYLTGLRQVRASTAAMLAAAEPAIATMLATMLLGEPFTIGRGVGVALIVFAAVLLARRAA